jgi:hypothetical protein
MRALRNRSPPEFGDRWNIAGRGQHLDSRVQQGGRAALYEKKKRCHATARARWDEARLRAICSPR